MEYVYWDSNCFIGYLQDEQNADVLESIIERAEKKQLVIVTSSLTLTEVLRYKGSDGVLRNPIDSSEEAHLEDCFSPENGVQVVNLDRIVASKARRVVWDRGIHPKDAVHVATAMQFKHNGLMKGDDTLVFHTFDKKLLKHGDGIDGIPFVTPRIEDYPLQTKLNLVD